jgi:hypothetical protein
LSLLCGPSHLSKISALCADMTSPAHFRHASLRKGELGLPDFLPELARLESMTNDVKLAQEEIPIDVESLTVNPSLRLSSFRTRACFLC